MKLSLLSSSSRLLLVVSVVPRRRRPPSTIKFLKLQNHHHHLYNNTFSTQSQSPHHSSSSSACDEEHHHHDIIISGGGLVGTTLALALAKEPRLREKSILLLEGGPKPKSPSKPKDQQQQQEKIKSNNKEPNEEEERPFSNRVFALNPGSKKLLETLGIWKNLERNKPVFTLQVWDALSHSNIVFNHPNYSTPVSYIVENNDLANAIQIAYDNMKLLCKEVNVNIEYGSKVSSCQLPDPSRPTDPVTLKLDGNKILKSSDLVIGADGFNSLIRGSMGSQYLNFPYDQTAIVATLKLSDVSENNNVAWQRFLPTGGPIALLPLSPQFSSLVWSTTVEKSKELLGMSSEEFIDAVNDAFWRDYPQSYLVKKSSEILNAFNIGGHGPRIYPPSISEVVEKSRASFPLGFGHSGFYVNRRSALIGDAAHRVHPLAGQGLNLGFGDVECLTKIIVKAVQQGADIGSLSYLKEYETERQRHNFAVQSGIDFLHRLYDTQLPPIVALRSIGLNLVNSSHSLKNFFIERASV